MGIKWAAIIGIRAEGQPSDWAGIVINNYMGLFPRDKVLSDILLITKASMKKFASQNVALATKLSCTPAGICLVVRLLTLIELN